MAEASDTPDATPQPQSQANPPPPSEPASSTAPAEVPLRVDDFDDNDTSYGGDSDAASETTSLYSAIFRHVYENGRRYHSYRAGTYW